MTNRQANRDYNIDFIRSIACIAVIGLHTFGINNVIPNSIIYYFCGFAVPFYFMASGYFLLNRGVVNTQYSVNKSIGILKIVVSWNVIYGLTKTVKQILIDYNKDLFIFHLPSECVKSLVQKGELWHFWFFGALIIVYLLLPVLTKIHFKNRKLLLTFLAVVSVCMNIMSYVYGYPVQKYVIQTFRIWTWLFYFLLGGELYTFKNWIYERISAKKQSIILLLTTILLIILQIYVGSEIIVEDNINLHAEYYYDSLFEIIWIIMGFSYLLRLRLSEQYKLWCVNASKLVMGIYIIHPIAINLLSGFVFAQSFPETLSLFILTVTVSGILTAVIKRSPFNKYLIQL